MKHLPIGWTSDGQAILHYEDYKSAELALERGYTEDEALYIIMVSGGCNYPIEQIKLIKPKPIDESSEDMRGK